MIEDFHFQKEQPKEIIPVNNPKELFIALTGLRKQKIEELGYAITESKQNIVEEKWLGAKVKKSYDLMVTLGKNEKELTLRCLIDHRFNGGVEPQEVTVEKNNFSKEELEKISNPPLT